MSTLSRALALVIGLSIAASTATAQAGSDSSRSTQDCVFSVTQAGRGQRIFQQVCAECHQPTEFSESGYLNAWIGQSVGGLFDLIRGTMPYDNPGRLRPRQYVDIVSYILSINGLPAGDEEMKSNERTLRQIRIDGPFASGERDAGECAKDTIEEGLVEWRE